MPGDTEAPRYTWLVGDYEPCDSCKELRKQGIDLIEATERPRSDVPEQPPYHGAYPTGRHMILREEAVRSIFSPEAAERLCEARIGFMDSETLAKLQGMIERSDANERE